MTQVTCERCFYKLKLIETRLQSRVSQDPLETFMSMSIEMDVLEKLKNDDIIDHLAEKNPLLKNCLLYKYNQDCQFCFNMISFVLFITPSTCQFICLSSCLQIVSYT